MALFVDVNSLSSLPMCVFRFRLGMDSARGFCPAVTVEIIRASQMPSRRTRRWGGVGVGYAVQCTQLCFCVHCIGKMCRAAAGPDAGLCHTFPGFGKLWRF